MQDVREAAKLQADAQRRIMSLLKGASKAPWWHQFVAIVRERRSSFLEELSLGVHEQRVEDRLRGQIQEDAWIILLNDQAEQITEGDDDGDPARTAARP